MTPSSAGHQRPVVTSVSSLAVAASRRVPSENSVVREANQGAPTSKWDTTLECHEYAPTHGAAAIGSKWAHAAARAGNMGSDSPECRATPKERLPAASRQTSRNVQRQLCNGRPAAPLALPCAMLALTLASDGGFDVWAEYAHWRHDARGALIYERNLYWLVGGDRWRRQVRGGRWGAVLAAGHVVAGFAEGAAGLDPLTGDAAWVDDLVDNAWIAPLTRVAPAGE